MSLRDALDRYFAGWNDHDPTVVVRSLVEGGTYEDPTTGGPLSADALAEHVAGLVTRLPDIHFDVVGVAATGETTTAVQWLMHGIDAGTTPAGPATGRAIALAGADFIDYDPVADRLSKVVGYFDTATLLRQLGLQTHVSPPDVPGRIDFGLASRVTNGEAVEPGCFTVTSLDISGPSAPEADEFSNSLVEELATQPGYLGTVFASVGARKYTFTAWRDVDAVDGIRHTVHRDAMRRFNSGTLGTRVMTSVWVPLRLNPIRVSARAGERPAREEPLAGRWL